MSDSQQFGGARLLFGFEDLLHRRAGIVASCAGDVMTNHAGLIRAEHVLTTRTHTDRGRRRVVGNERRTDSRAWGHGEGVPALHESRYGVTLEKFVDETGSHARTEGGRRPRPSWATSRTQRRAVADLRKQRR